MAEIFIAYLLAGLHNTSHILSMHLKTHLGDSIVIRNEARVVNLERKMLCLVQSQKDR